MIGLIIYINIYNNVLFVLNNTKSYSGEYQAFRSRDLSGLTPTGALKA